MNEEDYLDFEKPIYELKKKLNKFLSDNPNNIEKKNELQKKN